MVLKKLKAFVLITKRLSYPAGSSCFFMPTLVDLNFSFLSSRRSKLIKIKVTLLFSSLETLVYSRAAVGDPP